MPEGETNKTKKISKIIGKLISFVKFKSKANQLKSIISPEDEEIKNTWNNYKIAKAEDIMIPRIDITAIDFNSSIEQISQIFLETRHTRMPVYKESLDNIIGFVNIKDILPFILKPKENLNFSMEKVLRQLLIVSPTMKIYDLLEEMRHTRTHIALVVDEFGGADGLITIENLVEEIVGEIEDEHDLNNEDSLFKVINENVFEVSGRIKIEILEEKLNLKLENINNEEYDTLGGLILSLSNSIPHKGDKIHLPSSNIMFEILDSDPRRIKTVRILVI